MQLRFVLAAVATMIFSQPSLAGSPRPVSLEPIQHAPASLTVVSKDGETTVYSPSDLENLTTFRIETVTPWREEAAIFDGVMLKELLQSSGLSEVSSIRVTAENDYAVTIPRALWESVPVLVATRANGKPLSRRERGPIQFVIGSDDYANSEIAVESHLVWMAARIEAE